MSSEYVQRGLVIAGRYRVLRHLGEGGMGSVFLVEHVHTDEQLALKVLHGAVVKDPVALERFQREARTPARIASDHVCRVTDADVAPELGGVPFLVMEYLRGEDLDHVVSRRGKLPPHEVVTMLRQAARGLDKAHAIGVIHRDLKPENLFLTQREDGTPLIKLLDFGIAKLTGGAGELAKKGSRTSTGQIFGTPLFMSPEQALAESSKICPQTDVWALGLIAHKLLFGEDIWTAQTLTHLIAQIAYEPMPVPSQRGSTLGPAYDTWFATCVNRAVERRFRSAGEAIAALSQALGIPEVSMSGSLSASGAIRLAAEMGGGVAALANTGDVSSSQAGLLKSSAAPLSRTHLGSVAGRGSRRGLWILGLASASIGVVAGVLFFRTTSPAGSASTAQAATAAAQREPEVPVATQAPTVAPAPTASEQASAAPSAEAAPAPTHAPVAAGGPRPPVAKPSATPVAKPSATPVAKPTATPVVDPLAGRQ